MFTINNTQINVLNVTTQDLRDEFIYALPLASTSAAIVDYVRHLQKPCASKAITDAMVRYPETPSVHYSQGLKQVVSDSVSLIPLHSPIIDTFISQQDNLLRQYINTLDIFERNNMVSVEEEGIVIHSFAAKDAITYWAGRIIQSASRLMLEYPVLQLSNGNSGKLTPKQNAKYIHDCMRFVQATALLSWKATVTDLTVTSEGAIFRNYPTSGWNYKETEGWCYLQGLLQKYYIGSRAATDGKEDELEEEVLELEDMLTDCMSEWSAELRGMRMPDGSRIKTYYFLNTLEVEDDGNIVTTIPKTYLLNVVKSFLRRIRTWQQSLPRSKRVACVDEQECLWAFKSTDRGIF